MTRNFGSAVSPALGAIGMLLGLKRMGNLKNAVNHLMKNGVPLNMNNAKPESPGFVVPPGVTMLPVDQAGPAVVGTNAKTGFTAFISRLSPYFLSGLAGLAYAGSHYGIGKYLEKNMTEDEKKAFDKIKPARQKHESPSMFEKYKPANRRHN